MAISRMQEPRQLYGLGSLVKKITRPIKKVLKSPIGKGLLAAGIGFGIPGTSFGGLFGRASFGGAAKGLFSKSGGLGGLIKRGMFKGNVHKDPGFLRNIFDKIGGKGLLGIGAGAGLLGGLLSKGADETEEEYQDRIMRLQPYLKQYYSNVGDTFGDQKMGANELEEFITANTSEYGLGAKDGGIIGAGGVTPEEIKKIKKSAEYKGWKRMYEMNPDAASGHEKHSEFLNVYKRVKKAEGGEVKSPAPMEDTVDEYDLTMDEEMVIPTGFEKVRETVKDIAESLYKTTTPMGMGYKMAKAMYDRLPDISKQAVEEYGRALKLADEGPEEDEVSETMIMVEGKKDGGIMNLGGKEMDLRGGGFVPIGKKERADDVPARLSKNEFVFTADAVRAAGGGSVQKGAQKMYDTMKMLEKRIR